MHDKKNFYYKNKKYETIFIFKAKWMENYATVDKDMTNLLVGPINYVGNRDYDIIPAFAVKDRKCKMSRDMNHNQTYM